MIDLSKTSVSPVRFRVRDTVRACKQLYLCDNIAYDARWEVRDEVMFPISDVIDVFRVEIYKYFLDNFKRDIA